MAMLFRPVISNALLLFDCCFIVRHFHVCPPSTQTIYICEFKRPKFVCAFVIWCSSASVTALGSLEMGQSHQILLSFKVRHRQLCLQRHPEDMSLLSDFHEVYLSLSIDMLIHTQVSARHCLCSFHLHKYPISVICLCLSCCMHYLLCWHDQSSSLLGRVVSLGVDFYDGAWKRV